MKCARNSNSSPRRSLPYNVLSEKAAQDFCVPFYEALFTGKYTLQQAFDIATSAVRANSPKAAETFILIPTNGGHSGTQLF